MLINIFLFACAIILTEASAWAWMNTYLSVHGHCLFGDAGGRFSQVTCCDQIHLMKHWLKFYYLFQRPSPCSIFGMFLWCFLLSVNDLSSSSSSFFYRFLKNLPLAQILACSLDVFGHLLMISLFFPVYSNLCYIYYFFLHRKISGVLFLSPWLVSIRC